MGLVKFKKHGPGFSKHNHSFPSIFDAFLSNDMFDRNVFSSTVPAVNIKENENEFQLDLAVPGLEKENFKIEVENETLVISSEVKEEQETKKDNYSRKEFSYQSFKRAFTLPDSTVSEKISAKYADGVLKVVIPKEEEAKSKGPKNIKVV
jgi:HSP20 family protein